MFLGFIGNKKGSLSQRINLSNQICIEFLHQELQCQEMRGRAGRRSCRQLRLVDRCMRHDTVMACEEGERLVIDGDPLSWGYPGPRSDPGEQCGTMQLRHEGIRPVLRDQRFDSVRER